MIFPVILIAFSILAIVEQFRLYGKRNERLGITQMFVRLQAIILTGLLVLTWTSWFTNLFPIFENNQVARVFVFIVLLMGLVLSLLDIRRIQDLYQRKDKAYQRFIQLEKSSLSL